MVGFDTLDPYLIAMYCLNVDYIKNPLQLLT